MRHASVNKEEKEIALRNIKFPAILGTNDFSPSNLCQRAVFVFTNQHSERIKKTLTESGKSPAIGGTLFSLGQIVSVMGYNRNNVSQWRKQKGFSDWLTSTIDRNLKTELLPLIRMRHADLALRTTDASILKLIYLILDPTFAEKTSSRNVHEFPGFTPGPFGKPIGTADGSRQRQAEVEAERAVKTIDSKEVTGFQPDGEGPATQNAAKK